METREKQILAFSCAAHFLTHFFILVFPALVMPVSRSLSLPLDRVVNLSFLMYLLYGLFAIPWGLVSDKLGPKWAMALGVFCAGTGMILAGFSGSIDSLTVSLALVGIGCSAYHPSGMALISKGISKRGKALGINGIWGNLGIASAPFAAGGLTYLIGWQTGLIILGCIGIIVGIAITGAPLHVPRGMDRMQIASLDNRNAAKLFIIFSVGMIFSGFMYRTYTLILPSFLEYRLGDLTEAVRRFFATTADGANPAFDTLVANLVATCIYLVGIGGQIIGGRVADRFSLKWSYLISFGLALPFALGVALFQNGLIIASGAIFVFFTLGMQPVENSLVAFLTPPKWRSVSYGIKFTILFSIGSLAVKLVGAVEGRNGIGAAIWLVSIFLGLLLINTSIFLASSRGVRVSHQPVESEGLPDSGA